MSRLTHGVELTPEEPIEGVVDLATAAEAAGFEAVLSSCHYFNRDPFLALSRIARATDTVSVGPGVVNPYDAHPVTLASRAATLHELSDGRGIFGIGAGDASALAALGIDHERPLRRVLETLRVCRRLWAGETVTHEGTFEARDAALTYDVSPLPVYIGAQGPDMLRMGAIHADGVLYNAAHPRDVIWAAERIAEGRSDRDRADDVDFLVQASVSIDHDEASARETARQAVAFIVGGASPAVLDRHDVDPERAAQIGRLVESGDYRGAFEAVTEPMIDAFAIAGTPEQVAERIARIESTADGLVAATPLGPDRRRAIDLLADILW